MGRGNWHAIGINPNMKVVKLTPRTPVKSTVKLIKEMLKNDWDAFKATNKQFLRNNQDYHPEFNGMIA